MLGLDSFSNQPLRVIIIPAEVKQPHPHPHMIDHGCRERIYLTMAMVKRKEHTVGAKKVPVLFGYYKCKTLRLKS